MLRNRCGLMPLYTDRTFNLTKGDCIMDATEKIAQSRDKLISDLRIVVRDTEELLANTGEQASEGYKVARAKIEASLQTAKEEVVTPFLYTTPAASETGTVDVLYHACIVIITD